MARAPRPRVALSQLSLGLGPDCAVPSSYGWPASPLHTRTRPHGLL